jgi:hypothetical protein
MTDEVQNPLPPGDVAPATAEPQQPVAADVPNAAPVAVAPTTEPASAPSAAGAATTSPSAASSPAEPKTFEQRVEERFLALEHALTELPHSIMATMQKGSLDAAEFGKAVIAHLFSKL